MNITPKHIASQKVIGKLGNKKVTELVTTGGLHIVAADEGGKVKVLGTGPHRAIARYIAEKAEPKLIIQELSKSDALDPITLAREVPVWEEVTRRVRETL